MQTQRINITIPRSLLKQIDRAVPRGKRSEYFVKAAEKTLRAKKISLEESLKANYNYDKKIAKEWEVTELESWPE